MDVAATLNRCKHYDNIVNFVYDKNDTLTEYLINDYQDFIFTTINKDEQFFKDAEEYDYLLNEYVNDKYFYKFTINKYTNNNQNTFIEDVLKYLKECYEEYQKTELSGFEGSKWL